MKKIIATIAAIIPLSFLITSLVFIYRYMWFTVETIPDGRVDSAIMGTIITFFLWGLWVYCDEHYY